ncbi:MAG: nucleotidyltransferase family protein [Acidobacteria bacterium]|nr:nucleotidyltransferase family protein [Acidobacteriota bacterium]
MVVAIILAAGESTRMGRPKALLPDPDGRPFVARLARTFAEAGVRDLVVVTGRDHAPVADALASDRLPVRPVVVNNPDPSRGQLSSLWAGLDAASAPTVDAVLVALVDVPMVSPSTIRAIIDAWERSRAPIVRPAIGDRHGHPVLFDRAVFDELRRAPFAEGAKAVVRAHADRVVNVPVDDEGCLVDVDTPADYEAMRRGRLR